MKRKTAAKPVAKTPVKRAKSAESVAPAVSAAARQIPPELLEHIAAAVRTGSWFVVVSSVSGGDIRQQWQSFRFPNGDYSRAVDLLQQDLKKNLPNV